MLLFVNTQTAPSTKAVGWKKLTARNPTVLQAVVSKMEQHATGPGKKQTDPNKEDHRARRRRLYRLHSEQKPEFPYQMKNFYTHVMDSKEVVKTLSLLGTCTQELKGVRHFLKLALDASSFKISGHQQIYKKLETLQCFMEERKDSKRTTNKHLNRI